MTKRELEELIAQQKREKELNKHEDRIFPEVISPKRKQKLPPLTVYNAVVWFKKVGYNYTQIGKLWRINGKSVRQFLWYRTKRAKHRDKCLTRQ